MIPTLHITLLGDFLLVSGDTPVITINSPRLQSLLAYLVLHRNAPQDRSHLAFLLWPDSTEERAHTSLRKALHHLRQALPEVDHFLHVDRQSLFWQPSRADASWTLDVQDFEQALTQAEQAERIQDAQAMRQALEQAMSLYRGDLLPSCYDEWILPERDRLLQLFLSAAERLIALLEEERDYDAAIPVAQQLLRQEPLHEATSRQLMRLYALRGDRAAALRVYHTSAKLLERELGTEPSEATRMVYEALVQSDTSSEMLSNLFTPRGTEAPLIGRKAEWRRLQEVWRKAAGGQAHIVILSGGAGIGKTRLAEEMEAWVSRQGMMTASARCYAALGRLAYAPVTTWLRTDAIQSSLTALDSAWLTEVARLVPEVMVKQPELPRPAAMTEGWQRLYFFEALARVALRVGMSQSLHSKPLLLLLDDLHWCDDETLEWLQYLLHFELGARLLLIGTVRSEEIPPGHPLVSFLGALQRDGQMTEIALGPLTTTETTSLVEHVAGRQLEPDEANYLYAETEGNPLFAVEMVRAGTLEQPKAEKQVLDQPHSLLTQSASALSPKVQSVLATRLGQLSPLAREVANVAAVIGREFTFSVLARACRESEDTVVRGLDELWQRRIVREQGVGTAETYDFSHDKLRERAYGSLSLAHQRLLHRHVAEALEEVHAGNLDVMSRQIAAHYERAGLPRQAIPYYRRAGEAARRIYANVEAVTAFQQAIALLEAGSQGHALSEQLWEEAAVNYASLGDILAMTGQQQEARQIYQRGIAHVPPQEYIWHARLLRKMASTWNLASDNPMDTFHIEARRAYEEAERILEQVINKSSTEWLQEWIDLQIDQLLPLRGSLDEMTAIIEKAQPIVEQYGTAEQRGQFIQALVARDSKRDRYVISEETISYCRQSLAALQQTDNKGLIGFAHFVLGNRLLWANHLDEAEEEMRAAMNLAEQIGSTRLLSRCLMFLPFIFRRRGQVEEVRGVISRALAMPEARNIPLIKGNRAWIAWRDGNLDEADAYGRASIEEKRPQQSVNSFQWVGIWPLIGVALDREKIADAMDYVRKLLDTTQQPPPKKLRISLEEALQAWDTGEQEQAHRLLQHIVPLAEEMGYL